VCRGALSALAAVMRGLCEAPIRIAKAAVSGAQAIVRVAQIAFNKAAALVKIVIAKVEEAVKFVSNFQLKSISFTGGFKSMKVTLGATFIMSGRPKHFKLTLDMGPIVKSFGNMAKAWLKKVFEAVINGIKNFVNNLKNKIMRIKIAMDVDTATVLTQMDPQARVLLEADMAVVSAQMDAELFQANQKIYGASSKLEGAVSDATLKHTKTVALAVQHAHRKWKEHEQKCLDAERADIKTKTTPKADVNDEDAKVEVPADPKMNQEFEL
jgi:hypothetical protein